MLQAEWELTTWLALPWKPCVAILGRTVYTLNADANKVISRVGNVCMCLQRIYRASAKSALTSCIRTAGVLCCADCEARRVLECVCSSGIADAGEARTSHSLMKGGGSCVCVVV